ncbi:hypothetical protein [Thermosediminibacter oceani]|uniref:Uncharacterized protein n=1 Tax=Thermosediminibacter oceani (strain ATCC BAA-1034 / DSM 16646 / JW/IW-1228P) TaxID=555079 RepID=D9RXU2_THEOJ|nr:hypothetical protein [Thermosediminibacter oceani]ADL08166.1 hypothetical protein Toce_1413 [Thermosediminibacter oceani DSM 16646]
MKRKILSLLMIVAMLLINVTALAAENDRVPLTAEVISPEFPDAYIMVEKVAAKDIEVTIDGNDINVRGTTKEAQDFVRKYIANNTELKKKLASNKGKLVGIVSATAFVEETYEIVDDKVVVTNSRLLSKNEVDVIGIENFKPLETPMVPQATFTPKTSQRGTLTITFECFDLSYGSTAHYELFGDAHWDGFYFFYDPKNNPAIGEDFFGFAWGGDFDYDDTDISATAWWDNGQRQTVYLANAEPNAGIVWSFEEYLYVPNLFTLYVEDVYIHTSIIKNKKTGDGNTTAAILKYIHTYQDVTGTIDISAGPDGVGAGFTLSGTPNQWSLVATISGLYY